MYQRVAITTIGLFLIWLMLSESFRLFHMSLGFACALAVAWFNTERESVKQAIPWRMVLYFPWLFVRILKSGIHLSVVILHPRLPIAPKMISQPTDLRERAGIVLLGNSITLTPGTITVEAGHGELLVHAVDEESAEDVTSRRIERRIAGMFGGGQVG